MSPEEASLHFNEQYDLESVNDAAFGYFMISGVLAVATVGVIALVRHRRGVYAYRWSVALP